MVKSGVDLLNDSVKRKIDKIKEQNYYTLSWCSRKRKCISYNF